MNVTNEETVTTTTTTEQPVSYIPAPTYAAIVNPVVATTEQVEQVTAGPSLSSRVILYRMGQVVWLILALIEGLLAIRFGLRLLGANPSAGFAQFIYGLSGPFMAPFVGLFGTPKFDASVFEFTALVAMLVYLLLAWVIIKIANLVFSGARGEIVTRRTDTRIG